MAMMMRGGTNYVLLQFNDQTMGRRNGGRVIGGRGRAKPYTNLISCLANSNSNSNSQRTSPNEALPIDHQSRRLTDIPSVRSSRHQIQDNNLVAKLLDCTTWSGAGPGLMDAAFQGAFEAKKPVGGFKIARESGEWTTSNSHPYLPPETYHTCRFFSARKHGLVDAAVRNNLSDKTAVIAFPGGIGTLDEVFEILALIQLERIGSELPVPFLLMNYDSYYSKLLEFLCECESWGTVAKGEVASLWKVCSGNLEALEYLAEFYDLPESKRKCEPGVGIEQSTNLG